MSRFPVIDPTNYPELTLVEIPDEEVIIRDRMLKVKERWLQHDPPFGAAYDVENTVFDPIRIVEEAGTSFEMNALTRLNQYGRATTLVFAWGDNLEAIASRYPTAPLRQTGETDDRYRRRIWLSTELFNTAGAEGGYIYWALTALPEAHDASAVKIRGSLHDNPVIHVTVMMNRPDPRPTLAELNLVREMFAREEVGPLTDVVSVQAPSVIDVRLDADVWLFPAVSADLVMPKVQQAVAGMIEKQRRLGYDFTMNAYSAALEQIGVANAHGRIIRLSTGGQGDVLVSPRETVRVTGTNIRYVGRTE